MRYLLIVMFTLFCSSVLLAGSEKACVNSVSVLVKNNTTHLMLVKNSNNKMIKIQAHNKKTLTISCEKWSSIKADVTTENGQKVLKAKTLLKPSQNNACVFSCPFTCPHGCFTGIIGIFCCNRVL